MRYRYSIQIDYLQLIPVLNIYMSSLLKVKKNCWRIEKADRLSFLIDGADYFAVLREAMKKARHTIYILSWDINSQLELIRDDGDDGYPKKLGELLNTLVNKNPNLNIYILDWDFAMIYAASREWLPLYQLDWKTHSRVHFCLDDYHPSGASQHQKIVIIDEMLAFIGGLDLTAGRWDTSDHTPDNPKRDRVDDKIFRPYHDVQVMLEGDAAAALAEFARDHWKLAAGEKLQPVGSKESLAPWPESVAVDMKDVSVGLARTRCAYKQLTEVREIHDFYLDAIHSARHYVYIENQYFTVPSIAEAIQNSLEKEQGPEVVIVQPKETDGWLSQLTMDVLRVRQIEQMQAHDKYNRLRVYYPEGPGLDKLPINVHAKIMVVDDTLVTVGSANLNNRSMGLDNECNIIIDAESNEALEQSVATFHHRLLAEHLSCTPEQVHETLQSSKSLIATIDKLTDTGGRYLNQLPLDLPPDIDRIVPDTDITDPQEPFEPEFFLHHILPEESEKSIKTRIYHWLAMIAALTALAVMWQWTPLGSWIGFQSLSNILSDFKEVAALPAWIMAGFVLAGFVRIPISIVVVPAIFYCGLVPGFIYSLIGALLSAVIVYQIGKRLNRHVVRKLTGTRLNSISQKLAQHGIISIVAIRIVPVAPFTLINLVAGASRTHFRDFMVGTILGMIPGMLTVSLITDRAIAAIENPVLENLTGLFLTVAFALIAAYFLMSWIMRRSQSDSKSLKRN